MSSRGKRVRSQGVFVREKEVYSDSLTLSIKAASSPVACDHFLGVIRVIY